MSKTDRLYKIELLIRQRQHVSFRALREELEVSPATLKRDLEYLRSRLGAPIEYDALANGYRLADGGRGARHELPGLWFDERELYSLLMAHHCPFSIRSRSAAKRLSAKMYNETNTLVSSTTRKGCKDCKGLPVVLIAN